MTRRPPPSGTCGFAPRRPRAGCGARDSARIAPRSCSSARGIPFAARMHTLGLYPRRRCCAIARGSRESSGHSEDIRVRMSKLPRRRDRRMAPECLARLTSIRARGSQERARACTFPSRGAYGRSRFRSRTRSRVAALYRMICIHYFR